MSQAIADELKGLVGVVEAVRGDRGLLRVSGTRGDAQDVGIIGIDAFNRMMQAAIATLSQLSSDAPPALPAGVVSVQDALRDCTCPRPMNSEPDDLTVGECVDKGQCGCQNGVALKHAHSAASTVEPSPREQELASEVERLTKRLDLLAAGFDVPDGGRYIADWQTRIQKYKALIAAPTTSPEPDALREVLKQIATVCADNAGDECDQKLALRFVAKVASRALARNDRGTETERRT
jgi:hypothetical protein